MLIEVRLINSEAVVLINTTFAAEFVAAKKAQRKPLSDIKIADIAFQTMTECIDKLKAIDSTNRMIRFNYGRDGEVYVNRNEISYVTITGRTEFYNAYMDYVEKRKEAERAKIDRQLAEKADEYEEMERASNKRNKDT